MPAPAAAVAHTAIMDPTDRVEYITLFEGLLEKSEKIATASLTVYPEATLLGFTILDGGNLAAAIINDNAVRMWVEIAPDLRNNPAFDVGARMPVEFTITTDAEPFRRFNRTMTIPVQQL